jgi:hypothetical protein
MRYLALLLLSLPAFAQDLSGPQRALVPDINFVSNGGVEKGITGWSAAWDSTAGTISQDTDVYRTGRASLFFNPSNVDDKVLFPLAEIPEGGIGGTCGAEFYYYTTPGASMDMRVETAAAVVVSDTVSVGSVLEQWVKVELTFPCLDKDNAVEYRVAGVATGSGSLFFDDYYLGAARNIGTVAQAYDFGSLHYDDDNCTWSTSSTSSTPPAFSAAGSCPAPTVIGKLKAPSTRIPAFVIPAGSESGTFVVTATGGFQASRSSSAANCNFMFYDGAQYSNTQYVGINMTGTSATGVNNRAPNLVASIPHTASSTDRLIEIRAYNITTGSSPTCDIAFTDRRLKFNVTFFPDSSQTVVRGDVTDLSGFAKSPATASCEWQTTSATMAPFPADSDCPDSSTTYTSSGNLVAPDTKIPAAKAVTILPGKYMVVAGGSFEARESSSGFQSCLYEIYDGSSSGGIIRLGSDVSKGRNSTSTLVGQFEYSSKETNKTFQVRATRASGNGTCDIRAIEADLTFTLIPLSQGITKPFIPGSTYFGRPGVVKAGTASVTCSGSSALDVNEDGLFASMTNISSGSCTYTLGTNYFANANYQCVPISTGSSAGTTVAIKIHTKTANTFVARCRTDSADCSTYTADFICFGDN